MATKTYTITKSNRVANSPFTIEGSDMVIDITHEFPVPAETVAIIDGKQKSIRFIMGCESIYLDEQVKMGWPLKRNPSAQERAMLTFLGGMNSIPEGYSNLEKYLEAAPWFQGDAEEEKKKKRPPHSRILYQIHDQEQIDGEELEFEDFVTEARSLIKKGDKETLLGLLRLSRPGGMVDSNISVRQLKLQLLEVANRNPDFILKSSKTVKNDKTVLVSKAIDYGILNIDSPGKVLIQNKTNTSKFQELARIPDFGGRSAKIDRVVAYLDSDEGKPVLSEITRRCEDFEKVNNLLVDGSAVPEDETETTTTTTAATTTTTTTIKSK
jgi:hypothetical protein